MKLFKITKQVSKLKAVFVFSLLILVFFISLSDFTVAQGPDVDISVSASIFGDPPDPPPPPPPPPPPSPGSPSTVALPFPGEVVIFGQTSPEALVTIRIDGETTATTQASSNGDFEKRIRGLLGGTYNFSVFSEDSAGRLSSSFNFTTPVFGGRTTYARGIFLSPTASVFPQTVLKGGSVFLFGSASPESLISIFVSKPGQDLFIESATTGTNAFGYWLYRLSTEDLNVGWHQVSVFAISPEGRHSPFSQTAQFFLRTPEVSVTEPPPPIMVPEIEISPDFPVVPDDPPIVEDDVLLEDPPEEIEIPAEDPLEEPERVDFRMVVMFTVFFVIPAIVALLLLFIIWRRKKG